MKDTPCLSGLPTSWWWWRWWWRWWWWRWWRWRWRCGHLLSERASYKLVVNSHLWSDCEYIVIFPSYLFMCLRELPMFDWLSSRGEWDARNFKVLSRFYITATIAEWSRWGVGRWYAQTHSVGRGKGREGKGSNNPLHILTIYGQNLQSKVWPLVVIMIDSN